MKMLDIIVPVLNESENLPRLLERIHSSLSKNDINYRVLIIDDNSPDETKLVVENLKKKYPVIFKLKQGKQGKAYSILEGAKYSKSEYIVMIDGDLQYPPEAISEMYKKAVEEDFGVVIANRVRHDESNIRRLGSKVIKFLAGKMLMGLNVDIQSGLKLFKREIVEHLDIKDVKPWAFDIPLLHTAKELGSKIGSVDIDFGKRVYGKSKFDFKTSIKGITEVFSGAFKIKISPRKVFHLRPAKSSSMLGAGIIFKQKRFLTHTTLHHSNSALVTFTRGQKLVIFSLASILVLGLTISTQSTLIIFVAVLSTLYFADVFFNLFLVLKSLHFPPEILFNNEDIEKINDQELPIYTILCPLYHESGILEQFVDSIEKINYPKDKLEVLLLLEEDDEKTIEKAKELNLPDYFKRLIVPHSFPKTKPKACNYGLAHAKGEYVVIYDAEDIPDPMQLKKAVLGFKKLGLGYSCLQAKLNYHNPNQNLLTRFFTSEYSLWFDLMLPALQTINTTIPLGGTSNHFRRIDLNKFEGWDPFNVTEDADLGIRLFKAGGKTAIIDSVTLEEANSNLKNWIRQRSRWIKGYLQTYFVHMRNPISFAKKHKEHWLVFQLVSGLRISFMLINPILWTLTISYFVLYKFVGPQIESLYPTTVFYMAITSAVFGNFLYIYYYMIGTAKHGQYQLIKYVLLIPIYWVFTSIAAFVAFWQLLTKPHYWEKTNHGLTKEEKKKVIFKLEFAGLREFGFGKFNKIKDFSKSSLAGGAFLIFASMFGNVMNFLYNAYLGRNLELSDFGLLSLVGSFISISQIPLSGLSRTITHRSAYLLGKYNTAVVDFWKILRKKSINISYIFTIVWILLTPFLMNLFQTDQYLPFLIFAPTWIMGFAGAVDGGFLYGNMRFVVSGITIISESVLKLLISILIISLGFDQWVYLAIPLSILSSFLIGWIFAKNVKQEKEVEIEVATYFPKGFFLTSILTKISSIAFLSLDLVLAKIYLSPTDAGLYSLLSLAGKMIYFFGGQFSQFILPVVSKNEGEGKDSKITFYKLLGATLMVSLIGFVGIGVFGYITVPILFGLRVLPIVEYLPIFTFAMVMQVLAQSVVTFHQSKDAHVYPIANFVVSISSIIGVVLFHNNIGSIVNVMFIASASSLATVMAIHIFEKKLQILFSNVKDFMGMFKKIPNVDVENNDGKQRILVFNWRDTRHMWSGGAEVYIHEIAKRLVKDGNEVTLFCGSDGKSPRNEVIDGVQMIRRGGFYSVFIWAFLYYVLRLRNYFDVIIDSENGVPFFTPLYAKKKIFLLIHHIHQDVFRIKLRPPLSWIGKFLEKHLMPYVYKNTEIITVSPSSKADILEHKITNKEPHVIYNGVDANVYKPGIKSKTPLILYLGRLSPQKSLSVFVHTAKKIIESIPTVLFIIAGDGDDRKKLIKLVNKLSLSDYFTFSGKVTEEEKVNLYQKAWVFVNPSLIEGWGITTIEANACGVPVVASNVAGLRDAVHNPHSGFLVPYGDVDEFAKHVVKLVRDEKLRDQMSQDALSWSKKFDWRKSTSELEKII